MLIILNLAPFVLVLPLGMLQLKDELGLPSWCVRVAVRFRKIPALFAKALPKVSPAVDDEVADSAAGDEPDQEKQQLLEEVHRLRMASIAQEEKQQLVHEIDQLQANKGEHAHGMRTSPHYGSVCHQHSFQTTLYKYDSIMPLVI